MPTKKIRDALTFNDVLVVPRYSDILPKDVEIGSRLTTDIPLSVPIISAAMDTVTDYRMAIAMARCGGIGIIHKNFSIAEQAKEVAKVKRSESVFIEDPYTLSTTATLADAVSVMKEKRVGGIPIIDETGILVGIITNRDIQFLEKKSGNTNIKEVMHTNVITAPLGTTTEEAKIILQKHTIKKLPIVDHYGKLKGLMTLKDLLSKGENPNASKDVDGKLLVGAAVGIHIDTMDRVRALIDSHVDVLVLDSAHGHSKGVIDMVKLIKKSYPSIQLIAGNVASGEAALALAHTGANAVKIGIGPGSICTTRIVAGIGFPQLQAIMDIKEAFKKKGFVVPLIADGGITYSGDVVKAIVAGADTVMAGGIFAGTEESPGESIILEGRKFKSYRGMGSLDAMQNGSSDRYFQADEFDSKKLVPEGIVGRVPFKGTVEEVLRQFVGGLRAGMGYTGSKTILELQDAQFVRITTAGIQESHPHNVVITKEAPNYSK